MTTPLLGTEETHTLLGRLTSRLFFIYWVIFKKQISDVAFEEHPKSDSYVMNIFDLSLFFLLLFLLLLLLLFLFLLFYM